MAEADAIVPLDELDGVARPAAAGGHAAEEALVWGDDEVWGFGIFMEWAKPNPVITLFFQFNSSGLDESDQICVSLYAVNVFIRYSWHGYL